MTVKTATATGKAQYGRVVGLFAGIGGIERGLLDSGFETVAFCENDLKASAILKKNFPSTPVHHDIRELDSLPDAEVITAGFPCQDLSQAGKRAGIRGAESGLVDHVFRLLSTAPNVQWLVLENVPFMLRLGRGAAMEHLVSSLEAIGFRWAYRIVDTEGFGLPQRRRRVMIVASRVEDPSRVLFAEESTTEAMTEVGESFGFYWTEGNRGLGWAVDKVPPLKGSSGVGIPSPPAIWIPSRRGIFTPSIQDAERLQGFPADWTSLEERGTRREGYRWKAVGNAVSVPVAAWLGRRLIQSADNRKGPVTSSFTQSTWPHAAIGGPRGRYVVDAATSPHVTRSEPLTEFLRYPLQPLSVRATSGFQKRITASGLRVDTAFLTDLEWHRNQMAQASSETAK